MTAQRDLNGPRAPIELERRARTSPPESSNAPQEAEAPFHTHIELLRFFLAYREDVVERIQSLLSAQRRGIQHLLDRALLARHLEDCFFTLPGLPEDQARLRGQLQAVHWARGFKPRELPGMHNDLVDPAEMMRRAFHLWSQTRWPGRNGRVRYAHTLFNLYLLRQLALLAMRAWDAGSSDAGDRLAQAQQILDALWRLGPVDQPALVRDAHWLIPVAQSPGTDQLLPYFEVAEEIAAAFPADDRIAIQDAAVRLAGGHLRSYLHYYVTQKGMTLDDDALVVTTRKSDALDFSLLIHGLVPLLEAYENAVHVGDGERRLVLADAICQGISPDPELFIERIDLLGAYTMVEHLFTATEGDGTVCYTPLGRRHVRLLEEYEARIARLAKPLHEDCRHLAPAERACSPYGVVYGHASGLVEHMAFKTLQIDADTRFSLEDAFSAGDADKLAWVTGWRKLPHVDAQVAKLYDYPQRFVEAIFARVEQGLRRRAAGEVDGARRTGRLFILPDDASEAGSKATALPELPIRYVVSSDERVVAAGQAVPCDPVELASGRQEGVFALSYETSGGWVAVSKDLLTEVLGDGCDAKIVGLPETAAETLRLMCRGLIGPTHPEGASAARS